jgi:ceramide glucosyltransferase
MLIYHYLILIPILLGTVFWLASSLCVAIFMGLKRKVVEDDKLNSFTPSVSLIKPVYGLEKNLFTNLATACRQDYQNYEVIYTVQRCNDPALQVLAEIGADDPQDNTQVVVDESEIGSNGKVNNIYNGSLRAKGEILAISDSDMFLEPDYLKSIVAPLADQKVGIACTLYQAWKPSNIFEALELLTYNSDFVPSMLFAVITKASIACPGATMAIRREVLDDIGGLKPLANYFVEDFELGRRVVEKNYRIALIPYVANMDVDRKTFRDYWRHQVYWDQNTKSVNFAGYFFTLLIRGVPFALLYALCGGPYGWQVLVGAVGLRILTGILNALLLKDADGLKFIGLLPLKDLLGILVWLTSLFQKKTHWRGKTFILKKGQLVEVK